MAISTKVSSNAYNMCLVKNQVDPRTGQYVFAFSLPDLNANALQGPTLPLTLSHNPQNLYDTGYGIGWNLQLSQFKPTYGENDGILSLHSGEAFRVSFDAAGVASITEQKIKTFHCERRADGTYLVAHKDSGLIEILKKQVVGEFCLPVQVFSAQGRAIALNYTDYRGSSLLSSITDDTGANLLLVERANPSTLNFRLHPQTPFEALYRFELDENMVHTLVLPASSADEQAAWHFSYQRINNGVDTLPCLASVTSPTGCKETIEYHSKGHGVPGSNFEIPRVYSHDRNPGFGQPAVLTFYEYSGRNFLGWDSEVAWSDNGLDSLYKVLEDYKYDSTEILWNPLTNQAERTTRRVYNRFHLMENELARQHTGDSRKGFATQETRIRYHALDNVAFEQQPNKCQLPHVLTQLWYYSDADYPRHSETTLTDYNDSGNLTTSINANGVSELYEWYPAKGEGSDCAADPQGLERSLKRKTVVPAASAHGDAPVLSTHYRHQAQSVVSNQSLYGTWLAMTEETLTQVEDTALLGTLRRQLNDYVANPCMHLPASPFSRLIKGRLGSELRHIVNAYIQAPQDSLRHGLIESSTKTLYGDKNLATRSTYRYEATQSRQRYKGAEPVPVLRTISTLIGFDDNPEKGAPVRQVITLDHALQSGLQVGSDDGDGAVLHSEFDAEGRVSKEIVSPGHAQFEATREYAYRLSDGPTGQAMQEVTNVKQGKTRTWLDGFNRTLKVERWDSERAKWRNTYLAEYNALGQLGTETAIDWIGSEEISLTTAYRYDAWGSRCETITADGVSRFDEIDPTTRTSRSWSKGNDGRIGALTSVTLDTFGKPQVSRMFNRKGEVTGERKYRYDGLGNCVAQVDELNQTTRFEFDAFSRLYRTTLPNRNVVSKTFATFSEEAYPVRIEAGTSTNPDKLKLLGTQTYDGLGRVVALKVGPRAQTFEYLGGSTQPSKQVAASGKTLNYTYDRAIGNAPIASSVEGEPGSASAFDYDPLSAMLKQSQNDHGEHRYTYNLNGQLESETWVDQTLKSKGATVSEWTTHYTHSLNGRPLTRKDVEGLECRYEYNSLGQLERILQGQLVATFEYDGFGRAAVVTTENTTTQQSVSTSLTFDEHGREITRVIETSNDVMRIITQEYLPNSKLSSRLLEVDGEIALLETFGYDQRGRMDLYQCKGSALPKDHKGRPLVEQQFEYDALDNIAYAYTRLENDSIEQAFSTFAEDDPCQLRSTVYYLDEVLVDEESFEYDSDGNLLYDENGEQLHYDSQQRLIGVSDPQGGTLSSYRYDAHDQLLGVTHQQQTETLRFYDGERLSRTEQAGRKTHFLYGGEQALGQQVQDLPEQTLLLLSDSRSSVLAERGQTTRNSTTYGAYGERDPSSGMQCVLGFNGEVRDERRDWYLLGKGYRAYNTRLRRFHSPDSLSPFGAGGINPYSYCGGDPINFRDPTGHSLESFFGGLMSVLSIGVTVVAAVMFPVGGVVGAAFTIGFGVWGAVNSYETLKKVVKASTAKKKSERDRYGKEALTEGGTDLGFSLLGLLPGVFGAGKGLKGASKSAKATQATQTTELSASRRASIATSTDELPDTSDMVLHSSMLSDGNIRRPSQPPSNLSASSRRSSIDVPPPPAAKPTPPPPPPRARKPKPSGLLNEMQARQGDTVMSRRFEGLEGDISIDGEGNWVSVASGRAKPSPSNLEVTGVNMLVRQVRH